MNNATSKQHPECAEELLAIQAPSRLHRKDTSLFAEIANEAEIKQCVGWTALASNPPLALTEIIAAAAGVRQEGLDAVVLIGQGGSSQACMTVSKLYETCRGAEIAFKTMDSLSPVFVRHILQASDPARTLYIVSSKSGS
ncbi:MAG: hypothetical protein LBP91_05790, partial [Coriobacteriales bacterium]|nr:hypothetical protein [Coriobacteriales bacterium]